MQANLSRIHALLAQTATDIRRLLDEAARPLEANGKDFIIRIFESTTDADIKGYLERLAEKKGKIMEAFEESRLLLEYSFYLRREMDGANRSAGVSDKLLELNSLRKKLGHLYRLRQIVALSCSEGLDELKDAAYYKSSFTEKQRVFDLPARMFTEKDHQKIQAEIDEAEKASFALSDRIAFLNQTTTLEIMAFEEFKTKKRACIS